MTYHLETREIVAAPVWRPAWIVGSVLLIWIVVANALGWWVRLGAALDREALDASGLADSDGFTYLGLEFTVDSITLYVVAALVSTLIVSRDPTQRFGWFFGFCWAVVPTVLPAIGALLALSAGGVLSPSLAPWLALVAGITTLILLTGIPASLVLFPTGRFHSDRWRWIFLGYAAIWSISLVGHTLRPGPISVLSERLEFENPLGARGFELFGDGLVIGLVVVLAALAVVSLLARYRAAGQDERHQLKWFVFAVASFVVLVIFAFASDQRWAGWLMTLGGALVIVSIGVAILRYRLYEIDLIINRALVYASLAVFIGVVYVGVVVGVGSLVGSGDEPNAVLSVGATALVAVGFQPVRRRMEHLANRLVFGRKATPYEVLSDFSRRVAATSDDLLEKAAHSLAEGTRAERVAITVMIDGEPSEAAVWPRDATPGSTEPVAFPITDGDTALGSLDLFLPPGQELQNEDRRLAEQLAAGMALALRNQVLTERLETRVEELRESRRRLVAVQDETRRRLERDLHDGAQQQLVALKVKLGLGKAIAAKDGATQTAQLLERLSGEADAAVDAMREFARGVYPPLLEAEGLVSAISAQARRAPVPVSIHSDGIGRYQREIESTVYFCVLEALRNTVQHAGASQVTVSLTQSSGAIEFQVTDDGAGFETGADRGVGLTAMADRLDALTGDLSIRTEPGNGTTLTGTIPVPAGVPA